MGKPSALCFEALSLRGVGIQRELGFSHPRFWAYLGHSPEMEHQRQGSGECCCLKRCGSRGGCGHCHFANAWDKSAGQRLGCNRDKNTHLLHTRILLAHLHSTAQAICTCLYTYTFTTCTCAHMTQHMQRYTHTATCVCSYLHITCVTIIQYTMHRHAHADTPDVHGPIPPPGTGPLGTEQGPQHRQNTPFSTRHLHSALRS